MCDWITRPTDTENEAAAAEDDEEKTSNVDTIRGERKKLDFQKKRINIKYFLLYNTFQNKIS